MMSIVTQRGQITFPKAVREALRLHAGDKAEFIIHEEGLAELVPLKTSIFELKGMIAPPVRNVTLDEMDAAIAEGATDDDGD